MRDWQLAMSRHLRRASRSGAGAVSGTGNAAPSIAYEIAREKAAALGRLGQRLEAALGELEAFDRDRPAFVPLSLGERTERQRLLAHAARALWYPGVHRAACGLSSSAQLMRDYRVPEEVRRRMGAQEPIASAPESDV